MKQTLLRFLLTDWFGTKFQDHILYVGIGYLLIPWLALVATEFFIARRSGATFKEQRGSLAISVVVAALIASVPLFAPKLPIDSVPVFGWGFMLVLGFLCAGFFCLRRCRRLGLTKDTVWDLGIQLLVAGIIGSRVFYLVQFHERTFAGARSLGDAVKSALNFSDGGMVLYGGLILGTAAFLRFCHRRKIPALILADAIVPAVFIGMAFGRLGCLMNGCCFGDACTLPWAITFPADSHPWRAAVDAGWIDRTAPRSLPLHPTQIYSSINAFLIAGLGAAWFRRRRYDGDVLVLGLLIYPVTRIILEFLRNDEVGQFGTSFTISQWVSAALFVVGLLVWRLRPKELTPLPLEGVVQNPPDETPAK